MLRANDPAPITPILVLPSRRRRGTATTTGGAGSAASPGYSSSTPNARASPGDSTTPYASSAASIGNR